MSILVAKYVEYHFWHERKTYGDIIYLLIMCCAKDARHQAYKLGCDFFRLTFKEKDIQAIPIFVIQRVLKICLKVTF